MNKINLVKKITLILCLSLTATACTPKNQQASSGQSLPSSSQENSQSSSNDISSSETSENFINVSYDDGKNVHELKITDDESIKTITNFIKNLPVYSSDELNINTDSITVNVEINADGEEKNYLFTIMPKDDFYLIKSEEGNSTMLYKSDKKTLEQLAAVLKFNFKSETSVSEKNSISNLPIENTSSSSPIGNNNNNVALSYEKWWQTGLNAKKLDIKSGATAYLHSNDDRLSFVEGNIFSSQNTDNLSVIHTELLIDNAEEYKDIGNPIMKNVFYDIVNSDHEQYRMEFYEQGIKITKYSPKTDKTVTENLKLPEEHYNKIISNVKRALNKNTKNGKIQWLSMAVKDHITEISVQSNDKTKSYKYDKTNQKQINDVLNIINCDVTHCVSPEGKTSLPNSAKATVKFINGLYFDIYVNNENLLIYANDIDVYLFYDLCNTDTVLLYNDLANGKINISKNNINKYQNTTLNWLENGLSNDKLSYPGNTYKAEKSQYKIQHHLYDNIKKISYDKGCTGIFNYDNESEKYTNLLLDNAVPTDNANLGKPVFDNYFCEIVNNNDDKYTVKFYEKGVIVEESLNGKSSENKQALLIDEKIYDKILSRVKYRIQECEQNKKAKVQWLDMMKPSRIISFRYISDSGKKSGNYRYTYMDKTYVDSDALLYVNPYVLNCRETNQRSLPNSAKAEIKFNNNLQFDIYVNDTQLLIYASDIDKALIYDLDSPANEVKEKFNSKASNIFEVPITPPITYKK